MQVFDYRSSSGFFPPPPQKSVLSLGGFDGIHLGHQKLIQCIREFALRENAPSGLCLLEPLPFQVLRRKSGETFRRLFTVEETVEILRPLGLDFLCILPFDIQFSRLSPKEFVYSFLLKTFNPLRFVAGYDFSFAHKKRGNFSLLRRLALKGGFSVQQVSALKFASDGPVSSSQIRKHLLEAEIKQVGSLLGRDFSIRGKVKKGRAVGRKLGFPTANLHIKGKLLPPPGVYSGKVHLGKAQYKAAINIGKRPTFFNPPTAASFSALKKPKKQASTDCASYTGFSPMKQKAENSTSPVLNSNSFLSIEAHILEADPMDLNLYGKVLQLNLDGFIRKERAFSSLVELKSAIERDIQKILTGSC